VADVQGDREESQAVILTETEKERDMQDRDVLQATILPLECR
jgi:hypothetical protein